MRERKRERKTEERERERERERGGGGVRVHWPGLAWATRTGIIHHILSMLLSILFSISVVAIISCHFYYCQNPHHHYCYHRQLCYHIYFLWQLESVSFTSSSCHRLLCVLWTSLFN